MSQKNLGSRNVRACELETRYEFITYKGKNDQEVSKQRQCYFGRMKEGYYGPDSLNSLCSRHRVKEDK